MKKAIKNLKLGVLLTALVLLSSCGNQITVSSSIGINVINRTLPAIAIKLTKYSETKIGDYLNRTSIAEKGNRVNVKKVEKQADSPKVKPISISVHREARLL